jgi:hypothetical protein
VATVKTVSGTPFGQSLPLGTEVCGSFSYPVPGTDGNPSVQRGDYPRHSGTTFEAHFPHTSITGSGTAFVQVEDLSSDTFRFSDGEDLQRAGLMSRDGTVDASLKLGLAITDASGGAFASDALPATFPGPLLATTGKFPPHTFSLRDASGLALLQFDKLVPRPLAAPHWRSLTLDPSATMHLVWCSTPGPLYRVESSLDGVVWETLASGVASQGTTTKWQDLAGVRFPGGIPRILLYRISTP